ncbi:glycosyltransferase family 4 protein [bacterium SCSIO 12741]|nr:glycosyltransferase family 4 protein [bacterium SCSIO 12741]
MKILHVHNITGIAGSENYLLQILPLLKNEGIEVHFLCIYPGKKTEIIDVFIGKLEKHGIKVHSIPFGLILYPLFFYRIKALISKEGYDIVHSHLIHADLFLSFYKRFFDRKLRIVSTKHGYDEWYNNKHGFDPEPGASNLYFKLARWAETRMTRSFAISRGLQNLYVGLGICEPEKTDLIYYGFEFPTSHNPDPEKRFSPNQLVIVGRLTGFKGHRFAFQAIKKVAEVIPDVELIVVGSGALEEELKQQVVDLGVEKYVRFLGYQPDGRSFMESSDVVLIPSVSEGFGVVVLEAFSTSRPIVSFDVPSLNEHLKHEESGIIVPPYDTNAYADAIIDLLQNPEKRDRIGKNGLKILQTKYTPKRMVRETIEFYEKVISWKRKVLFLATYPKRISPSQRFRFEQYLDTLYEHEIEVDYFTFFNRQNFEFGIEKRLNFSLIKAVVLGTWKRFVLLFRLKGYDSVFIHRESAPVGPAWWEWMARKIRGKKLRIIYDFDDALFMRIEGKRFSRLLVRPKTYFSQVVKLSDRIVAGNEYLAKSTGHQDKTWIIPTSIDTKNLHNRPKVHEDKEEITIGWTGSHTTLRYLKAVVPSLEQLEKEGVKFRFLLICNAAPDFEIPNLEYRNWNLKSEIDDLIEMDIGLMPLENSSWSQGKCGLKILQYLSLGIPCVASDVGVNSAMITPGRDGFLVPENGDWKEPIKTLYQSSAKRQEMGGYGRKRIENYFSTTALEEKYLDLLR